MGGAPREGRPYPDRPLFFDYPKLDQIDQIFASSGCFLVLNQVIQRDKGHSNIAKIGLIPIPISQLFSNCQTALPSLGQRIEPFSLFLHPWSGIISTVTRYWQSR